MSVGDNFRRTTWDSGLVGASQVTLCPGPQPLSHHGGLGGEPRCRQLLRSSSWGDHHGPCLRLTFVKGRFTFTNFTLQRITYVFLCLNIKHICFLSHSEKSILGAVKTASPWPQTWGALVRIGASSLCMALVPSVTLPALHLPSGHGPAQGPAHHRKEAAGGQWPEVLGSQSFLLQGPGGLLLTVACAPPLTGTHLRSFCSVNPGETCL